MFFSAGIAAANEVYIGAMVQLKQGTISYKDHRLVNKPRDSWVRVSGTHQAIIDEDTWERVRCLDGESVRLRPTRDGTVGLFSGLLRCAGCGGSMKRNVSRKARGGEMRAYVSYSCTRRCQSGNCSCQSHAISESILKRAVLGDIQEKLSRVTLDCERILRAASARREEEQRRRDAAGRAWESKLRSRTEELSRLMRSLYEDRTHGTVSEELYAHLMSGYEEELKAKSELLREREERRQTRPESQNNWEVSTQPGSLTRGLLTALVERIEVWEQPRDAGEARRLVIHYKFTEL